MDKATFDFEYTVDSGEKIYSVTISLKDDGEAPYVDLADEAEEKALAQAAARHGIKEDYIEMWSN